MRKKIMFLFLQMLPLHTTSLLESMQAYARSIPEFPKITQHNWDDPEFSDQPTGIRYWYHYAKNSVKSLFRASPFWSTHLFLRELEKQIARTLTYSPDSSKNQIQAHFLQGRTNDVFCVWGDLYGSFHALVHALTFLHHEGIIDENLHIIKDNYYFLFLGNAINRSSRSFETLFVIILLLNANPEHVFYLQGQEEGNGYWHSFGLYKEIQQKFSWNVTKIGAISNKLDKFFDTLPRALFITLNDQTALEFAYNPTQRLLETYFEQTHKTKESIHSIIQGQGEVPLKIPEPDLELLPSLESSTTYWKVFSAYNALFKSENVRSHTSFVQITLKNKLQESTITNYQQQHSTFIPQEKRLLFSGEYESVYKKIKHADRPIVTVGSSLDLSSELGPVGREFSTGLQTKFLFYNIENSQFLIKHYILNDQGKPSHALSNAKQLVEKYHINVMLSPVGDATVPAFASYLQEQKIPLLFPVGGTSELRTKELTNVVNFEPSYVDEMKVLLEYLLTHFDGHRFAFIVFAHHEDDRMLRTAHEMLVQKQRESIDIIYPDKMVDLKKQIDKMKEFGPDMLGFIGSPSEIRSFINDLGVDYLFNKVCFFPSLAAHESFKEYMHKLGVQSIFANAMPHPAKSDLEIVQDYRALMKKAESPLSTTAYYLVDAHSLQSYIGTTLFLDALEKMGNTFSAQKLLEIFEHYKNYHYKGLTLTFNPQTRSLSQPVWLEYDYHQNWIALFPLL